MLVPDNIRNRFLATVLSESNLNLPAELLAVIPNSSASLTSFTKLSKLTLNFADVTVLSTLITLPANQLNVLAVVCPPRLMLPPTVINLDATTVVLVLGVVLAKTTTLA